MSSNNLGKQFEKRFKEACEKENIFYHRIADAPTSFSGGFTQFTNKSLADAFIFYNKNLFVVEFKSTKYKSISIDFLPSVRFFAIKKTPFLCDLKAIFLTIVDRFYKFY